MIKKNSFGLMLHLFFLASLVYVCPAFAEIKVFEKETIWAPKTRGSEAAIFLFLHGRKGWVQQSGGSDGRALPVRSVK